MPNFKTILALDPSGAFYEGKGTTGWCLFDAGTMQVVRIGFISAKDFLCMEAFWHAHVDLIRQWYTPDCIVVMEDYLLYAHKTNEQINSRMETPKVIGVLQHFCWKETIPYYMQTASEAKPRWTDAILEYKGYIVPKGKGFALGSNPKVLVNRHCKDAIRHAVHYATFKNKNKESV